MFSIWKPAVLEGHALATGLSSAGRQPAPVRVALG
jgi:hypothetical protein